MDYPWNWDVIQLRKELTLDFIKRQMGFAIYSNKLYIVDDRSRIYYSLIADADQQLFIKSAIRNPSVTMEFLEDEIY